MLDKLNKKIEKEVEKIINKEELTTEEILVLIQVRDIEEQKISVQKSKEYFKTISEMPFM